MIFPVVLLSMIFLAAWSSTQPAFAGEPERQLQWDLIWTGHYEGTADGIADAATDRAVRSFQLANRMTPDGHLVPAQRERLARQAAIEKNQAGWTEYRDAAGYRIGYPSAVLPLYRPLQANGQEFYRADRSASLTMMMTGPDNPELFRQIFDRIAADETHVLAFKVFRTNWFVISYTIDQTGYYIMSRRRSGATIGYILRWPKSEDRIFRRIATAVASSFIVPDDVTR